MVRSTDARNREASIALICWRLCKFFQLVIVNELIYNFRNAGTAPSVGRYLFYCQGHVSARRDPTEVHVNNSSF